MPPSITGSLCSVTQSDGSTVEFAIYSAIDFDGLIMSHSAQHASLRL